MVFESHQCQCSFLRHRLCKYISNTLDPPILISHLFTGCSRELGCEYNAIWLDAISICDTSHMGIGNRHNHCVLHLCPYMRHSGSAVLNCSQHKFFLFFRNESQMGCIFLLNHCHGADYLLTSSWGRGGWAALAAGPEGSWGGCARNPSYLKLQNYSFPYVTHVAKVRLEQKQCKGYTFRYIHSGNLT